MNKEKILGMTIKELSLSSSLHTLRAVQWIITFLDPGKEKEDRKRLLELASELKVADLISAWDKTSSPYLSWSLDYSQRSPVNTPKWFKEACEKLIQIGLTRVEWIALPSSTVSLDALRSLGKEDLLKKRVLMLGTLSYKALKAVSSQLGKFPHLVTIEDLLSTTEDQWGFYTDNDFSVSAIKTCYKLKEIGFKFEDGKFLQFGTRRQFINTLMEQEKINRKQAEIVARVAFSRGWIKQTLRWLLFM